MLLSNQFRQPPDDGKRHKCGCDHVVDRRIVVARPADEIGGHHRRRAAEDGEAEIVAERNDAAAQMDQAPCG